MTQKTQINANLYFVKNQYVKFYIDVFICVNLRILRHLRSFSPIKC